MARRLHDERDNREAAGAPFVVEKAPLVDFRVAGGLGRAARRFFVADRARGPQNAREANASRDADTTGRPK